MGNSSGNQFKCSQSKLLTHSYILMSQGLLVCLGFALFFLVHCFWSRWAYLCRRALSKAFYQITLLIAAQKQPFCLPSRDVWENLSPSFTCVLAAFLFDAVGFIGVGVTRVYSREEPPKCSDDKIFRFVDGQFFVIHEFVHSG